MNQDDPQKNISFAAVTVECTEAIDWEIVRVTFNSRVPDFTEDEPTYDHLSVSANFEFNEQVQAEFHDGVECSGDTLQRIDLWRDRVFAITASGTEFHIGLELDDVEFCEVRKYLRVLLRSDRFQT